VAERLFGLETEYAYALLDRQGQRIAQTVAVLRLLEAAQRRLIHLPDVRSAGMFLTNGARLYIDCGDHPEFAGPEVTNPWDAARYIKAGEAILADLAAEAAGHAQAGAQACLFRQNVDYSGSGCSWGSHESYLHRADPQLFRAHLIPHLVSRLIYTGGGGFDSRYPGIRFVLSPRVPHLSAEVSHESTCSRGILHTKDESLSAPGWHRLHLLCSESLFSEWGIFLRVGATALVVAMVEAGLRPGHRLRLRGPLEAMRAFAQDPWCQQTVATSDGHSLTAVVIQRHYLSLAEEHLHESFMPPWAEEVCRQWREVLDLLEHGCPESAATRLDWAIRFSIFDRFLASQGFTWQTVQQWNQVAETLQPELAKLADAEEKPREFLLSKLAAQLQQQGSTLDEFTQFLKLRHRIFELDTRFGQVGNAGLFCQLERAGVLRQHFPGVDNLEHAREFPPAAGRARLRGEYVRRLGSSGPRSHEYACDWGALWDRSRPRVLDLSKPFAEQADWRQVSLEEALEPGIAPGPSRHLRQILRMA